MARVSDGGRYIQYGGVPGGEGYGVTGNLGGARKGGGGGRTGTMTGTKEGPKEGGGRDEGVWETSDHVIVKWASIRAGYSRVLCR